MNFNSLSYFLFLPLVYMVFYYLTPRRQWVWLLLVSYFFYSTFGVPYLLVVLGIVTLGTYWAGIEVEKAHDLRLKKGILLAGISFDVLALVVIKYLPFVTDNLNLLLTLIGGSHKLPAIPLLTSIAVSFIVFQAISYLIDIYLEIIPSERHLGYFALSLAFFPKLLQGPIERSGDLLPQLRIPYVFSYENFRSGLILFAWGLFKKMVIADRLGFFVNAVYNNIHAYSGFPLLLATWLYAFQLYFDFSGYTDMALGSARLFNIQLTQNFNRPYLAASVADFWRRWHISFSKWILDYLFKPLQMRWRLHRNWGTAMALLVTFLISGLWHGASWGFVVWGALHGLYLATPLGWKKYQKKLYKNWGIEKSKWLKAGQIFITFQLICFAWIFFRAQSLADARYIVTHMLPLVRLDGLSQTWNIYLEKYIFMGQSSREFGVALLCFILSITISLFISLTGIRELSTYLNKKPFFFRWGVYYMLLFATFIFAVYTSDNFIYYQF